MKVRNKGREGLSLTDTKLLGDVKILQTTAAKRGYELVVNKSGRDSHETAREKLDKQFGAMGNCTQPAARCAHRVSNKFNAPTFTARVACNVGWCFDILISNLFSPVVLHIGVRIARGKCETSRSNRRWGHASAVARAVICEFSLAFTDWFASAGQRCFGLGPRRFGAVQRCHCGHRRRGCCCEACEFEHDCVQAAPRSQRAHAACICTASCRGW